MDFTKWVPSGLPERQLPGLTPTPFEAFVDSWAVRMGKAHKCGPTSAKTPPSRVSLLTTSALCVRPQYKGNKGELRGVGSGTGTFCTNRVRDRSDRYTRQPTIFSGRCRW